MKLTADPRRISSEQITLEQSEVFTSPEVLKKPPRKLRRAMAETALTRDQIVTCLRRKPVDALVHGRWDVSILQMPEGRIWNRGEDVLAKNDPGQFSLHESDSGERWRLYRALAQCAQVFTLDEALALSRS